MLHNIITNFRSTYQKLVISRNGNHLVAAIDSVPFVLHRLYPLKMNALYTNDFYSARLMYGLFSDINKSRKLAHINYILTMKGILLQIKLNT